MLGNSSAEALGDCTTEILSYWGTEVPRCHGTRVLAEVLW